MIPTIPIVPISHRSTLYWTTRKVKITHPITELLKDLWISSSLCDCPRVFLEIWCFFNGKGWHDAALILFVNSILNIAISYKWFAYAIFKMYFLGTTWRPTLASTMGTPSTTGQQDGETMSCLPVHVDMYLRMDWEHPNNFGWVYLHWLIGMSAKVSTYTYISSLFYRS